MLESVVVHLPSFESARAFFGNNEVPQATEKQCTVHRLHCKATCAAYHIHYLERLKRVALHLSDI